MQFYPQERIALFIDGANLYATAQSLDVDIDYRRFLANFRAKANLMRALYYTTLADHNEYSSLRPLIDWLAYNGFTTVTKTVKEISQPSGRGAFKGSINVELAVDALRLAPSLDHVVIVSGDGVFRYLVAALQDTGKRVSIVATLRGKSPTVADELRRQADQFIDLDDLHVELSQQRSGAGQNEARPRASDMHMRS